MASIKPHKDGYRAQVYVKGVRDSSVFRTKREASAWASRRETELRTEASLPDGEKRTLGEALDRYAKEVSTKKRGERWEVIRLAALKKILPADTKIGAITASMMAQWRDDRLASVKSSTVNREATLLSDVFSTARREWGWIKINPLSDVRRPPNPPHRSRLITTREIRAMLVVMGYTRGPALTVSQAAACVFIVALRTGIRAGELCSLTWGNVHHDYVHVDGKTGPRDVPITRKTAKIIEQCKVRDATLVFNIKSATLDALFRRYRDRAGLSGFTFHDSRHVAATWIAQKLQVLDLCKVFGWTNPAMAMRYYNPTASDIAKRLSHFSPGQSPQ